jgi:hypothetical protein
MANFIDLDSIWRDREINPNENSYEVGPNQICSWYQKARTVMAVPQNPNTQPLDFSSTISIKYLTLPYSDALSELPRVYINFYSKKYKDVNLINSINGIQNDAKFICAFDRVQNDINGNPLWIHYKCKMRQAMRFARSEPVLFQITTRDGSILPQLDTNIPDLPDPTKQTLCTFEITPLIRDGYFSQDVLSNPHYSS